MSYKYEIKAQFLKAGASFVDEQVQKAVEEGVEYYNATSLLAKNKKQILNYYFQDNLKTLCIELKSDNELPTPSRALKVLSTYLVKCDCLNDYISNKQLLKMGSNIVTDNSAENTQSVGTKEDFSCLDRISRYVRLLQNASRYNKEDLDTIDNDICKLLNEME